MASLIKCRKCGGPHVTLKCGKESNNLDKILEDKFTPVSNNTHIHDKTRKIDKRKIVVNKISAWEMEVWLTL
jgi:hypothetical protein